MKLRLRIPLKIPMKNELTPSPDKRAFFAYQAVKRKWWSAIPEALPHQRAVGARRLTIVRLMEKRERPFDTGNVYFSCAAIIDIVVKKGYLVGDEPHLLELEKPVQRRAGPGEVAPSTYLELEDL